MRLLIAEDDKRISNFLMKGLKEEGFAVDCAFDGEECLFMAGSNEYDLIILDRMMPKKDGLTALQELRAEGVFTPVLMLTAMDAVEDRVRGLDGGADDYLTKPFAFSELLARIRSLLRRGKQQGATVLAVGRVAMDLISRTVKVDGKYVELTAREYSILEYLMRNPGVPLKKAQIYEHVWGDYDRWSNVVDVHLTHLRSKLAAAAGCQLIETIRGVGYVLTSENTS